MNKDLLNVFEKYKAQKGGPEQEFIDKHTDNVKKTSAPGRKDKEDAPTVQPHDRKSTRQGYNKDEDEEYYEEHEVDEILNCIDEAVEEYFNEAPDEERMVLESLLSTDEGYMELVNLVMEENGDDDDDDDEEDDDDDDDEPSKSKKKDSEIVDTEPKTKDGKGKKPAQEESVASLAKFLREKD